MPVQLKNNLTFAKKEWRDDYIKSLGVFLKNLDVNNESIQGQGDPDQNKRNDAALVDLKKKFQKAISLITPSPDKKGILFNNMQMAALLAFEAAFFKEVQDKADEKRETYMKLHKELYGESSHFQKQLDLFEGKVEKDHSIDKNAVIGNPTVFEFDAKLQFQRKVEELLAKIGSDNKITLPKADDKSAIAFLANIDPNILAYVAVNNPITVKIEKHKVIDILHEGLIGIQALCCAIINTGMLLAPPAALGAAAFVFGGASLPLTIGVALFCLSAELAYHEKKDFDKSFESSQVGIIKGDLRRNIDENLNNQVVDIRPKQLWSPMQLFDVERLLKSTINYTISSYKNHKKEFQEKVPEVAESLQELIKYNYIEHKQSDKNSICTKGNIQLLKEHNMDLVGFSIDHSK